MKLELNVFDARLHRTRMLAKIALGLGYVEFGDGFRAFFQHDDLRRMLRASTVGELADIDSEVTVDIPYLDRVGGHQQFAVLEELFRSVGPSSCIAITPGPDCIAFSVGIIGTYLGTVFCPCDVDSVWPHNEDPLGRLLLLRKRKVLRMDMRNALERLICSREFPDVWSADEPKGLRDIVAQVYANANNEARGTDPM